MAKNENNQAFEFGAFRLDAIDGRLERDGREIALTPTLLGILLTLLDDAGRIVTKQQFMARVWPGRIVEDGNLARNVSTLRKLLDDDPQRPRYIETVPRRGYRFVAPVETPVTEDRNGSFGTAVSASGAANGSRAPGISDAHRGPRDSNSSRGGLESHPSGPARSADRSRARNAVAATIALCAVIVAAVLLISTIDARTSTSPIRSLVVLPFENLSGDAAQTYFAEGMTEELISSLGRVGELSVTSRTSSMHYRGTRKRLPEIASELGVDAIVEGSVLRAGDHLRFTVRLVDAATDRSLWTETYERPAGATPALYNEVTRAIVDAIDVTMTPDEARRFAAAAPIDQEAHELYLRGMYLKNRRTVDSLHGAISHFERAIEIEPRFAQAYAAIADTQLMLASWQGPSRDLWPKAREAAKRALEIDDNVALAHLVLAGALLCHDLDAAAAEPIYLRSLDLNPGNTHTLRRYAYSLMTQGRFEESLRWIDRSIELDPVSVANNEDRGRILHFAARYDEAIAQLLSTIELDPNYPEPHRILGMVYLELGKLHEATLELEKALTLDGGPGVIGELGYAYGIAGRTEDAKAQLEALDDLAHQGRDTAFSFALVYYGLGDRDRTYEWLDKAYVERDFRMVRLGVDPLWNDIRAEPRFQALLERIGLKAGNSA